MGVKPNLDCSSFHVTYEIPGGHFPVWSQAGTINTTISWC